MSLGKRIKSLRSELKLTQEEFARKIGIQGKQLSRYESDVNTPSFLVLIKIADITEVSLDYLAYGTDKKLAKRSKIQDNDLLELTRQIDKLKKPKREQIKWAMQQLLKED